MKHKFIFFFVILAYYFFYLVDSHSAKLSTPNGAKVPNFLFIFGMNCPNICFHSDAINLATTNDGSVISMELAVHCFDVVIARLNKQQVPKCPPSIPNDCFPLFVTWNKGHCQQLRGCIGTFSRNLPLHEGLNEYAQISAFRDSRFDPVALHELPSLHCSVSLLLCFEPVDHYRDWVVGVHGIRIEYRQHHRALSAVYLPEVAYENGWDHVETLNHLMWKGGFKGDITEADRQAVLVERFQSEKISVSYDEYMVYKEQMGSSAASPHSSRTANNHTGTMSRK